MTGLSANPGFLVAYLSLPEASLRSWHRIAQPRDFCPILLVTNICAGMLETSIAKSEQNKSEHNVAEAINIWNCLRGEVYG